MAWTRVKRSAAIAVALAVPIVLGVPGTASAEDANFYFHEYVVSDPSSQPCNVTDTPDGALWVNLHQANQLARLDPITGEVAKFTLQGKTPIPGIGEIGPLPGPPIPSIGTCDMAYGSDGNLWFNHQVANTVGYIETQYPYRMREFQLPTPASIPMSLQAGADGKIYVTSTGANKFVQIDTKTYEMREFVVPTPGAAIIGGTAGPDGAHWFVEITANKLLRFDYATGEMREFPVPTPVSLPFVIRSYDDGLWFTSTGANAIGHFDTNTSQFSQVPLPTPLAAPIGLTLGKDGDIYTDESVGDKIARIDRTTKTVVAEYPYPARFTFPDEIKTGPDGAIWSPNFLTGKVTRLWVGSFGEDPGFPGAIN